MGRVVGGGEGLSGCAQRTEGTISTAPTTSAGGRGG